MKYPKLTGICERAIKNNLCNGCSKLENPYFTGQEQCNLVREPIKQIKESRWLYMAIRRIEIPFKLPSL